MGRHCLIKKNKFDTNKCPMKYLKYVIFADGCILTTPLLYFPFLFDHLIEIGSAYRNLRLMTNASYFRG